MARLIKIKSTFQTTIDIQNPTREEKDVLEMLLEKYNETAESDGEERIKNLADADDAVLHDIIRECLEDDADSVLDTSDLTEPNNFEIEVLK